MSHSGRLGTSQPPPRAPRRSWTGRWHGREIEDPWHWLRDPAYPEVGDPDVIAYLEAENAYFDAVMAPLADTVESLFAEIRGRQQEDDAAVPWREGGWFYRWHFEPDNQYRIWSRAPVAGGDEQIILDENRLADGRNYFQLGGLEVDPSGRLLAYASDVDGSERFHIEVLDLDTGERLGDRIDNTLGAPVWTADGQAFLYLVLNENWRPYQVRLHRLGTDPKDDVVLYTEDDESFFVGVGETQDRAFLVISSGDHVTSESRVLPAHDPLAAPLLISARRSGHEYDVDHAHGRFWIRTNDRHQNFRIVSTPDTAPEAFNWREEIAPDDHDYLLDHTCFREHLVVHERRDGLDAIRIRDWQGAEHFVSFPEPAYAVGLGSNAEFDAPTLRLGYASMVTPDTVYDYEVAARRLITRKVRQIPTGYDPGRYVTERLWLPARDGARIPVSLVRRCDQPVDSSGRLYLTGYGAYGSAFAPTFSAARLSLLERGYTCAIAHIRGGDDLGYGWYEAGKLEARWNTFNDFEDVARGLIAAGYSAPGRIAISGGSAGGELMGVVMNQAPELWGAVVAHVPFVDVLQTMLDASLPLTPIEWPEWGNPIESVAHFDLIRSYSPYDNVHEGPYPPLLVTAGINDPRVTYWEPAKWVAKLRALRCDDQVMLLKTNMSAGHGGVSGRWDALRELAEEYAFILAACGEAPVGGARTKGLG
ncbi:MAG: S9 family peptidase [Gammaproteobacteria bacterium]|nr:MAG: S9 family peptidase [Gammaproteobacteria bacterium]